MTYPRTLGHPRTADEALDMIEQVISDQWRATQTAMLLDGVDPDAIDGAREWLDAELVLWRPLARAQIVAMLAHDGDTRMTAPRVAMATAKTRQQAGRLARSVAVLPSA